MGPESLGLGWRFEGATSMGGPCSDRALPRSTVAPGSRPGAPGCRGPPVKPWWRPVCWGNGAPAGPWCCGAGLEAGGDWRKSWGSSELKNGIWERLSTPGAGADPAGPPGPGPGDCPTRAPDRTPDGGMAATPGPMEAPRRPCCSSSSLCCRAR